MCSVTVSDVVVQIEEAIGRDEFRRIAAELDAEAGTSSSGTGVGSSASTSSQQNAAGASIAAAAGFGEEDLDDGGFFDMDDEATGTAAAAAAGDADEGSSGRLPPVDWSRHDPNTFFAVEVEEDEEAEQQAWYRRPGPFDDMFRGSGENLLQEKKSQNKKQQQQRRKAQGSSAPSKRASPAKQ